jgi:hypothetical protein
LREDLGGAVGDDPLEIVLDIDVPRAPDIVEELEDGVGGYAIGQTDADGDRLIVDGVHRQSVQCE